MKVKGSDLEIKDTDKYEYILTYSFPCQDLSLAGLRKGMSISQADGGTRSGLLWEVERILTECKQLGSVPNVLIMENVPAIHSEKDYPNFEKWMLRLEELGYCNFYTDLNGKDFGIPQNRDRCFMVSILGKDINYKFPRPIPRKYNLKDFLEPTVAERYYLTQAMVDYLTGINQKESKFDRTSRFVSSLRLTNESGVAGCVTTAAGQRVTDNFVVDKYKEFMEEFNKIPELFNVAPSSATVLIKENTEDGYRVAHEGDGINISSRMHHQRGNVQYGMSQTLKTTCEVGVCEFERDFRIRKLTPKEAGRLMAFQDIDVKRLYESGLSDGAIFHCMGDSIIVTTLIGILGKLFGLSQIEIKEIIYNYIEMIKDIENH